MESLIFGTEIDMIWWKNYGLMVEMEECDSISNANILKQSQLIPLPIHEVSLLQFVISLELSIKISLWINQIFLQTEK